MRREAGLAEESDPSDLDEGGVYGVLARKERIGAAKCLQEVLAATADGPELPSVMELFSPPRLTARCSSVGFCSRGAFDLESGWDARSHADRR